MTRDRWQGDPIAEAEADRVFRFIGQYVIVFQSLENKVEEAICLAHNHEKNEELSTQFASMPNFEKICLLTKLAKDENIFSKVSAYNFEEFFDLVVERLHLERERRNSLIHSKFLFDFLAIGAPVISTGTTRQDGGFSFQQNGLTREYCDSVLREIAELYIDLNHAHVQLVHSQASKHSVYLKQKL